MSAATRAVCDAPPVDDSFEAWERHADWWQKEFTGGVDAEYEEQTLPLAVDLLAGCRRVVDIGCGEGQVARRLVACVGEVVGAEPAGAQIGEAACRRVARSGHGPPQHVFLSMAIRSTGRWPAWCSNTSRRLMRRYARSPVYYGLVAGSPSS